MAFKVRVRVDIDDTMRRLSRLKVSLQKKCLRKAVTKGSQATVRHAKTLVPKRLTFKKVRAEIGGRRKTVKKFHQRFTIQATIGGVMAPLNYSGGQLKKSLGFKIKTYVKAIVGICGPRSGFRQQVGTISRGKNKGRPIYIDPQNYAHLVELGTRHSAPKPFLRPAAEVGARTASAVLRAEVNRVIAEEGK